MNILLWILFGALVGWIGGLIANVASRELLNMAIYGIVGGITGGWIATILCGETVNSFNIYSVLSAALGGGLVVWAYRGFTHHGNSNGR